MCASYEARFNVAELVRVFAAARVEPVPGQALPNWPETDEVRPTNLAPVIRAAREGEADGGGGDLVMMRFGFPPPKPKAGPVINYRSEGRRFSNGASGGRCLVPASGFYEFTGDRYPKTRWVLRGTDGPVLALAAVWRAGRDGAPDAFSLLTAEPGPDVAPYHTRGVIPLPPAAWADWLFDRVPAEALLVPPPAGALQATLKPRPGKGG